MEEKKRNRNHVLDWVKLGLACLVVLIHVPLPGMAGIVMNCFGRIAVPTFFAISGYFSYRVDRAVLRRRAWHIVKLLVFAAVIYYSWNILCFVREGQGTAAAFLLQELSLHKALLFLVFQYNWYLEHLWYLAALILCYLVLLWYVCFAVDENGAVSYRPLYGIVVLLLAVHFLCQAAVFGLHVNLPNHVYRNGWFFGIPMFAFSLFFARAPRIRHRMASSDAREAYRSVLVRNIAQPCAMVQAGHYRSAARRTAANGSADALGDRTESTRIGARRGVVCCGR